MPSRVCAALVLALVACGSDPNGTPPAASGPSEDIAQRDVEACPATFAATNGGRCRHEHAICTVPITCSTIDQQATCTCTGGRFTCSDGLGRVPVGDEPRCVVMDSASTEACAPTLEETEGSSCETLGHSCAYPGAFCPERPVPNMDTCTCLRDGTTGALAMKCRVAQCNPLYGEPPGAAE
jgi:hypothetical protein